ncbi:antitoxin component YwqK of YwqJK toxin-antitoxin module [Mariniflexile fucanivorans]|uniref:Antitoxin component YwqK of YwqJK toxin-antitoxin module n=1 Tax=Mariniflexile fucanivorans TaxID=264023 RepID=A0A4R1RCS6_9FLAO|nr:hypothetical protein [Mariniflexile fucanivorans]TCL63400.1 antitoxin component YwqK of YwqJK toxin-antitoxin module [Mariniflexile fucanivorans]
MKSGIYYFFFMLCITTANAQLNLGNYPRTYYPQVFFDSNQAENALQKGASTIKGMAYAIDVVAGQRVLAREGTLILLFPYTNYLHEWLNLTNKNKNNIHSVYLLPEVFNVRRETTTDRNGNYSFSNLKPGKYYIETIVDYNATALETTQTGTYSFYNMDRYGNMSGGSIPTYGIYSYQYATAKRLFKVVEIENSGDVKKANLKPTALVPFVDLDVVGAKTNGIKCYEEKGALNGNCITYHTNGKEKINVEWKKGLYDGAYKEYSENGNLIAEGEFKKDFKINEWKYYDGITAKLTATENFKFKNDASFSEGLTTFYYPSGKIKETNLYLNGKLNGEGFEYYENGNLKSKFKYIDGSLNGLVVYYNENGEKIKEENYKNGKPIN